MKYLIGMLPHRHESVTGHSVILHTINVSRGLRTQCFFFMKQQQRQQQQQNQQQKQ